MEAIALNLKDLPRTCIRICDPWSSRLRDDAAGALTGISARAWFLMRFTGRILLSRVYAIARHAGKERGASPERVFIHSWADERAFQVPGTYTDTYFGTLGKDLKEKGYRCAYAVSVLPTIFYPRAVSRLMGYGEEIYLFEEFVGIRDLLAAFTVARRGGEGLPERASMTGIDISPVIRAEILAARRNTRAEQSYLAYRAARAITRAFPVGSFIYTFENHMWEKMFCAGFRLASPRTLLVGYAHSIVNPMYLSYSLSSRELATAPLPDRIAVNGPHARENLVASGFPPDRVVVTGAFRYPSIGKESPLREKKAGRTVLVPLTAGIDESLELALKSVLALGGVPGIRVILKPHPSISVDVLLSNLPGLPPSVEVSSDPVDRLLDRADLVLYTSTTVAVEALGRGIPLVHVKSDSRHRPGHPGRVPDGPVCGGPGGDQGPRLLGPREGGPPPRRGGKSSPRDLHPVGGRVGRSPPPQAGVTGGFTLINYGSDKIPSDHPSSEAVRSHGGRRGSPG